MSNPTQEITPDQLLESFRGRSIKSVILFTVIVHVVVVCGSSVPYLMKMFTGDSASKLSETERTELAAREATESLRDIATKHGLKPQDLSTRIAGGAAPKALETGKTEKPATPEEASTTEKPATSEQPATPESSKPEQPEKPKSAIQEQLEIKKEGPTKPAIPVEESSDEDLFGK